MSEVEHPASLFEGLFTWGFLIGIFTIPIMMAITTTDTVQGWTNWQKGYSMILGAIFGIIITVISAYILEKRSR